MDLGNDLPNTDVTDFFDFFVSLVSVVDMVLPLLVAPLLLLLLNDTPLSLRCSAKTYSCNIG